jgi:hypothetical protein
MPQGPLLTASPDFGPILEIVGAAVTTQSG